MKELLQTWIEQGGATIDKLIKAVRSRLIENERLAQKIATDEKILQYYGVTSGTSLLIHL